MGLVRQRLSYGIGNEHNPADSFGRNRLVIETDGRARLDKFTRADRFAWTGTVMAGVLDSLWSALERAGFPSFPCSKVPALGRMHSLSIGPGPASAKSVSIYIGARAAIAGYDEAFTIIDAIIRQMSDDTSESSARKVEGVARVAPDDPRFAIQPSPGTAYLLAYLAARKVTESAREELLDRYASSDDPALARAIASEREVLEDEQSTLQVDDVRLTTIADTFDVFIYPPPVRADETPAWLREVAEAVDPLLGSPVLEAAWRAGEAARRVALSAALVATVAQLRCAAPENADLGAQALDLARNLMESIATFKARLEATHLPRATSSVDRIERRVGITSYLTSDLAPNTAYGSKKLSELAREIRALLEDTGCRLDGEGPDPDVERALEDEVYRESLREGHWGPATLFLARAGAYFRPTCEEVQYTDWNGTPVGSGPGAEIRAGIPPDPTLPFADLESLLRMGDFARELVARHPSTPEATLLELLDDPHYEVSGAIRARPTNPPAVLERIRERDAPRPVVNPLDTLRERVEHVDDSTRESAAASPYLPRDAIEKLAADPSPRVRRMIAKSRDLTPDAFARLAERELTSMIVNELATNPDTPSSVVARLFDTDLLDIPVDVGAGVRLQPARTLVARHPSLTPELALACARDENASVRAAVAENPSTDPSILDQLIDDPDEWVREAVAKHPRFTQLLALATDPTPRVCRALAERTDAPGEVLELLARDQSSDVRRMIAARTDTPREVLELLTRDSQTIVRDQATTTLEGLAAPPARARSANEPAMTVARDRIRYGVGSTSNPTDPFGHSDLVIEADGNAKLIQSTRVGDTEWTGRVASSALDALWRALENAAFPIPLQNMPAGSALRVLTFGTGAAAKSTFVAYHAGAALPGYGEAFWILDSIIRQLSEDTVQAVPPYGSQIVAAITRLPAPEPVSPGTAFAMAYLPARRVAHAARLEFVERNAATDPKLEHAIDFSRHALTVEESVIAESDTRLSKAASAAGISLPPTPSPDGLRAWLATWTELVRPYLRGLGPAAWLAGETGRGVAVSAELLAHIAYLRCAAPQNADLSAQATERARNLKAYAAALAGQLNSTGVPLVISHADNLKAYVGSVEDLEPVVAEGYRQLNELVADIYKTLDDIVRDFDTPAAP